MAADVKSAPGARLDRDTALRVAERMLVMRRFEEKTHELYERKLMAGMYHLYIGQEAGGAAVLEALGPDDHLLTNHRGHGHVVGRGADLGRAFAELLGRRDGLTGGRGGSVHMCDPTRGFLTTSAILGGNIGLALGAGWALKRSAQNKVVAVFFGDASLEEGITYEVLNIAAMKKLPIVFALENNNLGAVAMHEGGFSAANTTVKQFEDIPGLFGVATRQFVAADDIATKVAQARAAVAQCRDGNGPVFCELQSVHWPGSNMVFAQMLTGLTDLPVAWGDRRAAGEHAGWTEEHDPVLRMAREFVEAGVLEKTELLQLDAEVCSRVEKAAQYALDSPWPDPQTALRHVFAGRGEAGRT
jgi:acetoin:2,6-dichlorophenolindophenol oxidoreductase subunit alpha